MTSVAMQDAPVTYDIEDIKRRVSKAKSLLFFDHPFFGVAASKRPIIYTETTPTAAMSATGQMYMNPQFVDPLNVQQLMFLIAHEAMHYMLCHSLRMGPRDHTAWNIACDKVINDTLIHNNVGQPIEGGVYLRDARNFSAEELYDENEGDDGGYGGSSGGSGGPCHKPTNGGIGNDIGPPCDDGGYPLDESQIHQITAQTKIETIQAAKAAKAIGKLPASIERIVDELVNVSTPWHEITERYMSAKVRDGKSFRTPNRKYISKGIYLKGKSNLPKMGPVALIIDVSGSVDDDEIAIYNGHINRILHTCTPEVVHVIYCDTHVRKVDEFTPEDWPVTIKVDAGGGTAFKPAFDYIDDNALDPEVVIYLTDGYGNTDFTTTHETIWLTTGSTNFPFGTVIEFKE